MKLIDKDALVAEIKRRKQTWQHQDQQYVNGGKDVCDYLLGFLDTLEVKEVDLEKTLNGFQNFYAHKNSGEFPSAIEIAKHFFELGMQVSNKERKGQ